MDPAVTGLSRVRDVVGMADWRPVLAHPSLDSADFVDAVQHRSDSADVLHASQSHRGLSYELVQDCRYSLEALRDLDLVAGGLDHATQTHVCASQRHAVSGPPGDQHVVTSNEQIRLDPFPSHPLSESRGSLVELRGGRTVCDHDGEASLEVRWLAADKRHPVAYLGGQHRRCTRA